MRRILALLFLLGCFEAKAVFVDALVVLTNAPNVGSNWTVNGSVRIWTNAQTATTIQTNTASVPKSTTNLVSQIQAYPYGGLSFRWLNSTSFYLSGSNITITIPGAWAGFVLTTNSGPITIPLMVPPNNLTGLSNRTNNASWIVDYLNRYASTNFLEELAVPMQRFVSISNAQTLGNKVITNSSGTNWTMTGIRISGATFSATNSYCSNCTADAMQLTNSANHGSAFSSPGTGSSSEQFGNGAQATGDNDTALGSGATASGTNSFAAATLANASGLNSVAVGTASEAQGENSSSYGAGSFSDKINSTAVGASAAATHTNSTAVGYNAQTTAANQTMLGSASVDVVVNNKLTVLGYLTNSILAGTNVLRGDLSTPPIKNSALVNGNNADVLLTNIWNQLAGPTANFTNAGFLFGNGNRAGLIVQIENTNGFPMAILNQSGLDATPANRVITGTGGTLVITNNPGWVQLRYDADISRWKVQFISN
jgi:hypothetical protein